MFYSLFTVNNAPNDVLLSPFVISATTIDIFFCSFSITIDDFTSGLSTEAIVSSPFEHEHVIPISFMMNTLCYFSTILHM